MSDDERLDLRDLPPVKEPPQRPARLSQTLLRYANNCPRAAYLYLVHHGGAATHPMDRGSLVHLFAERMMVELITRGESSLFAPAEHEDPVHAAEQVGSLTAAMIDGLLAEHPELVMPTHEIDAARMMAYHLAVGLDVDPQTVTGVERKFVLDLECGWTISGKIDLCSMPDPLTGFVDDYKTSWDMPTAGEFASSFQTRLYAVLYAFGVPVETHPCGYCDGLGWRAEPDPAEPEVPIQVDCEACAGKGRREERLDPIGQHLRKIRCRELYPRYLWERDGRKVVAGPEPVWMTRTELADFLHDVNTIARRVTWGLDTGKWPARAGDHCTECPSEPECPLPARLRRFAGRIQTVEQAAEALEWAQRMGARVSKTRDEAKRFAKSRELPGVPLSGEEAWMFRVREQRRLRTRGGRSDWDGMEAAIEAAVKYGQPFDLGEFVRPGHATEFKLVKTSPDERAALNGEEPGHGTAGDRDARGIGERFGDEAPF